MKGSWWTVHFTPDQWPAGSCHRRLHFWRRGAWPGHLYAGVSQPQQHWRLGLMILCCGGCSGCGGRLGTIPASTCRAPGACALAPTKMSPDAARCAPEASRPQVLEPPPRRDLVSPHAPCGVTVDGTLQAELAMGRALPRAAQRQNLPWKRQGSWRTSSGLER